jgi:hypothetical protein
MMQITNYKFLCDRYPNAAYIGSDFGGGIDGNESDALSFAVKPVYFDDEAGRHYFDALPFRN